MQAKGRALGDLMIALADERLSALGVGIASLRDGARRGNHVSLTHPEGYRIMQALIARGVIGDFRAPDVMRFGFGPLYVRYVDIFDAVAALEEILKTGAWKTVPIERWNCDVARMKPKARVRASSTRYGEIRGGDGPGLRFAPSGLR